MEPYEESHINMLEFISHLHEEVDGKGVRLFGKNEEQAKRMELGSQLHNI